MIQRMFTIYDKKNESYRPPFCSHNEFTAMRFVHESALRIYQLMLQYPEDFALWETGVFDDARGRIAVLDQLKFVAELTDVIKYYDERRKEKENVKD